MFFEIVNEAQPDAIFGLMGACKADTRPEKVDLLVGTYKDEHLKTELLPSVKKAKEKIFDQDLKADYLPFDGDPEFLDRVGQLVFGESEWQREQGRIYSAQTLGGTGALRLGGEFVVQEITPSFWVSNPPYANHRPIFERAGGKVDMVRYYNKEKRCLDFDAMLEDLEKLPEKSCVVLQAACHNPTGVDPTIHQWKELSLVMKEKKLLPFFDVPYQGLGEGIEADAEPLRLFLRDGHEMLIAYSCSKNFSLYCQRVGALFIVNQSGAVKQRVGSQIKRLIRAQYSNPPAHGVKIVTHILKDSDLKQQWQNEVDEMRQRINFMRVTLLERLVERAKSTDFRYLQDRKGMFLFLDLTRAQVQKLADKDAIYLLDSGRINIAGLCAKNINHVVDSLVAVCEP